MTQAEQTKSHMELMNAHTGLLKTFAQGVPNSGAPVGQPAGSAQKISVNTHHSISNDTPLVPLKDYTLVDNALLFLPPRAVHDFGIEPNMDDKGDSTKTLWFGRVWELRGLISAKYALSKQIKEQSDNLSAKRERELDMKMKDPEVKALLTKLAARWKGAILRIHMSLTVLERLRFSNMRGSLVYAHGSGGCSWDNFRICRMIAGMGIVVIAPDGFAYPQNTAMGQLRHKDLKPLKKASDNVDYWEGDLMYDSAATGAATYSTKADDVLSQPHKYMDMYEKCYQLRRSELHFILQRLPRWMQNQGYFIGGTSEGAMTVHRFDDQRYREKVIGRFINSFGMEYCYFTPTREDGLLGGQLDVPTLNIIGTKDQYFGPIDSVTKIVALDPKTGYGADEITGNGYKTMAAQGVNIGLVCVLEEGVHSPCDTHDNFLRELFHHFFTRPGSIWELDRIWAGDSTLKDLVQLKQTTATGDKVSGCNVTQLFVPTMLFPQPMSSREVEALSMFKRHDVLEEAMQKEALIIKAEKARVQAELDKVRKTSSLKGGRGFSTTTACNNFYSGDARAKVANTVSSGVRAMFGQS